MRRLLNKPWFAAALAVGAVSICVHSLLDAGRRPARVAEALAQLSEVASDEDEADGFGFRDAEDNSLKAVLAAVIVPERPFDPFGPREETSAAATEFETGSETAPLPAETIRLAAIWMQESMKLALINGRICEAGTMIGSLKLETVDVDGVWISNRDGRAFLPLGATASYALPEGSRAGMTAVAHHEG